MKKIININLSGRVIPIEDSAYEKLQAYIESLRRYFANEEGRDEIINDIESRIAELMSEKIRKGTAVITDDDIEEIASSMGRPEDLAAAEEESKTSAAFAAGSQPNTQQQQYQQQQQNYSYSEKKTRGRLYRDTGDKIVGGVCSGLAAYLNVDPSIIRILFAIISFGGFGFGILAYIILWIVLPPKDLEGFSGKRLYRNPDDKVIGGVAGGLAAYFNRRSSNIRLIFAAPILLSILIRILARIAGGEGDGLNLAFNIGFGSLTGTFILTYIILWIVLPEANSDYQKMEMRGEKVDVNRIRQNVQEGMGSMKERMKAWGNEVKESAERLGRKANEYSESRRKAFAADVNETARSGGRGLGHVIGVLFKAFFLFVAGTIAFALFVALIAAIFGGVAWWPVNNFLWTSKWQQIYAWGTLIFFLGVPLIAFITWIIRRLMRVKSRSSYLGWTFGALWTLGWVVMVLFVSSITKDFSRQEHDDRPMDITQPKNGKMIVAVSQPELEYSGNFGWISDRGRDRDWGWDLSEDTLRLTTVKFDVKASTDSLYGVTIKRYSNGRNGAEAMRRAEKIIYTATWRDSVLDLGNGYAIDKNSKFRGQQVEIEIRVPVGKKIRFDRSVNEKLNPVGFFINRTYRNRRVVGIEINEEDVQRFRSDVDYIMGVDGVPRDSDGNKPTRNSNDYRYKPDNDTSKKQTEQKTGAAGRNRNKKNNQADENIKSAPVKEEPNQDEEAVIASPSPVFSLIGGVN